MQPLLALHGDVVLHLSRPEASWGRYRSAIDLSNFVPPPPPPPSCWLPVYQTIFWPPFILLALCACQSFSLPLCLSACVPVLVCKKGRGGGGGRKRTLFYKDCSLGSVKTQLVLAKLLINKNKLKSYFLKLFIWSMNKRENLYMKHENACVCVCV